MGANRFMSLEEKTRRVQEELSRAGKASDWHAARREMSRRSAEIRRWKKLRRKSVPRPVPIMPYQGTKLIHVPADNMTVSDAANIARQAQYLRDGRAARGMS